MPPKPRKPPSRKKKEPKHTLATVDEAEGEDNTTTWEKVSASMSTTEDSTKGENLRVIARTRPLNKKEINQKSPCVVEVDESSSTVILRNSVEGSPHNFTFDNALGAHSTQRQMFQTVGCDLVNHVVQGYNTCMFAYGQTSSGKSHSMIGIEGDPGIIPRLCSSLFYCLDQLVQCNLGRDISSFVCEASYFEIYNEKLHDLLTQSGEALKVREHKKLGVYVEGLQKRQVRNADQANEVLEDGLLNRTVQATKMNSVSSRSHAIFELRVTQKYQSGGAEMAIKSKLSLVDLAGSERAGQQGLEGKRLTEGNNINKSLSTLMMCIHMLVKQSHKPETKLAIPFRDSKLTWILRESLGGNAKTTMLAAVSPAQVNYEDSLSTLRYASSAKNIKTKSKVEESPLQRRVRELQGEVERLQQELGKAHTEEVDTNTMQKMKMSKLKILENALGEEKILQEELNRGWVPSEAQESPMDSPEFNPVEGAVYFLSNLNKDTSLSGRWQVPVVESLQVGREHSEFHKENGWLGLNATDIQPLHCELKVQSGFADMSVVTIEPVKSAVVCVNGKRISEPTELSHGDRVILGEAVGYAAVFIDMSHAIAPTRQPKSSGARRRSRRVSVLYSPLDDEELHVPADRTAVAITTTYVDALLEMLNSAAAAPATTTPPPEDPGKDELLQTVASARAAALEANNIAKDWEVGLEFKLELKTEGSELTALSEQQAGSIDLDSAITYDKFNVFVRCFCVLPVSATANQMGFNRASTTGARWRALTAAGMEMKKKAGQTRAHLLFEGKVDDLMDVVGALRSARQSIEERLLHLLQELGVATTAPTDDQQPSQESRRYQSQLEISEAFNSLPSVKQEGAMDRRDLIEVMNVLNISAHSSVDDIIFKYDSTGQGKQLNTTDFKRVLATHMRTLLGASVESLVEDRRLFKAFLNHTAYDPFESIATVGVGGRRDTVTDPMDLAGLRRSRSASTFAIPMAHMSGLHDQIGLGRKSIVDRLREDNHKLRQQLSKLSSSTSGGLGESASVEPPSHHDSSSVEDWLDQRGLGQLSSILCDQAGAESVADLTMLDHEDLEHLGVPAQLRSKLLQQLEKLGSERNTISSIPEDEVANVNETPQARIQRLEQRLMDEHHLHKQDLVLAVKDLGKMIALHTSLADETLHAQECALDLVHVLDSITLGDLTSRVSKGAADEQLQKAKTQLEGWITKENEVKKQLVNFSERERELVQKFRTAEEDTRDSVAKERGADPGSVTESDVAMPFLRNSTRLCIELEKLRAEIAPSTEEFTQLVSQKEDSNIRHWEKTISGLALRRDPPLSLSPFF